MTTTKTRRTKAAYEELLAEQERSGLTLRAFAEAKGIPAATLYSWSRRLRRRARTAEYGGGFKLVELGIVPGPAATGLETRPGTVARSPAFEVAIGQDIVVAVPPGFDAGELRRLIAVLRRA